MPAQNDLRETLVRREQSGCAFVMVFGASGSGKSSLIKAGLLPDLLLTGMVTHVGLVRHVTMRPSDAEHRLPEQPNSAGPVDAAVPRPANEPLPLTQPADAGASMFRLLAVALLTPTALPELAEEPLFYDQSALAEALDSSPNQILQPIRQALGIASKKARLVFPAEARLIIVIDQFEELFTAKGFSTDDRQAFIELLDTLARSGLKRF